MNYIILDLEWNQAAEKAKEDPQMPFEIIEIGAVKADENGCIIDEFTGIVRPVAYPQLYYRIREVVHISDRYLEQHGKPFTEVMQAFLEWCGEDYRFCIWGSMDLTELQKNIAWHKMENPFPFPLFYYDIQKLYSLQYSDGKTRCALETAIDELGFRTNEPFHRAVSDAYYTGLVMGSLRMKTLKKMVSVDYYRVPQNRSEEIYLVFDGYSKLVTRPYPNREAAMKESNVSSTVCYRCGCNVRRRLNWFSDNTKHYYSLSWCPVHGWLKGKIRTKRVYGSDMIFMVKTMKLIGHDEAAAVLCRHEELKTKRREKKNKQAAE